MRHRRPSGRRAQVGAGRTAPAARGFAAAGARGAPGRRAARRRAGNAVLFLAWGLDANGATRLAKRLERLQAILFGFRAIVVVDSPSFEPLDASPIRWSTSSRWRTGRASGPPTSGAPT